MNQLLHWFVLSLILITIKISLAVTTSPSLKNNNNNDTTRRIYNPYYSTSGCGLQVVRCQHVNRSEAWCNPNARIIGGHEIYKGEHPWMVILFMRDKRQQFCAGTLLDESHVLTATHCIYDFDTMATSRLRVVLGDFNIHTAMDGRHEERRVAKIFRYPKWNPKTNEHDLAIIKLRRPVPFTTYIQPICLPSLRTEDLRNSYEEEHDIFGTIVGWGRTSANPNKTAKSSVPVAAHVPLREHAYCEKVYAPYHVTENMLCAGGDGGSDACLGDSGGPLLIKNRYSGKWEQFGIISWGNRCHTLPGIYTRVENYLKWIYSVIISNP